MKGLVKVILLTTAITAVYATGFINGASKCASSVLKNNPDLNEVIIEGHKKGFSYCLTKKRK